MTNRPFILNRRKTLRFLGAASAAALLGRMSVEDATAAGTCDELAAQQTEGPYWVDEMLNRSDVRVDPTDGSIRPGVLLVLSINVQEVNGSSCAPLVGAHVDIWQCDAAGTYSDEAQNNTVGKKYLRGYQVTDDSGGVQFTTIYPGWYSGRTVHIHVRVRTYSGSSQLDEFTAQLFFDDATTNLVFQQAPYNQRPNRDTTNSNDMVLTQTNGALLYLTLAQTSTGYAGSVNIGVDLKTPAKSKAILTAGGVVSAASYQAGVAPGSLVAIFGQNLAAPTHALASSDLVGGGLPTSLGGVSVEIDNQAAFPFYVSPSQVNVQAPLDANLGTVNVTVTNSAGTSDAQAAILQTYLPAFFTVGKYVAAVRSDGTVVTEAAKAGEILELYGTGFGPTTPPIASGSIPLTAVPLTNIVTVTIGGVAAPVGFAGITGAGLYQLNVTVPSLPDGDHEVIAQIGGVSSQSGVLLNTQSSL